MKKLLLLFSILISAAASAQIVDNAIKDHVNNLLDVRFGTFSNIVSAEIDKRISVAKLNDTSTTLVYFRSNTMIGKGTLAEPFEPNPAYIKSQVSAAIAGMTMTTTQRNSLKPAEGQVIWNTTLKTYQQFIGGTWKTL